MEKLIFKYLNSKSYYNFVADIINRAYISNSEGLKNPANFGLEVPYKVKSSLFNSNKKES